MAICCQSWLASRTQPLLFHRSGSVGGKGGRRKHELHATRTCLHIALHCYGVRPNCGALAWTRWHCELEHSSLQINSLGASSQKASIGNGVRGLQRSRIRESLALHGSMMFVNDHMAAERCVQGGLVSDDGNVIEHKKPEDIL